MKPQNVNQVKNRTIQIATFETAELTALPALMKVYVALVEAVQKMGGEVKKNYSSVQVFIPKNREQLADQLESEQREWDRKEELYKTVQNGEAIKSYQEYGLKEWAETEGLPEPVFVKEPEDAEV